MLDKWAAEAVACKLTEIHESKKKYEDPRTSRKSLENYETYQQMGIDDNVWISTKIQTNHLKHVKSVTVCEIVYDIEKIVGNQGESAKVLACLWKSIKSMEIHKQK